MFEKKKIIHCYTVDECTNCKNSSQREFNHGDYLFIDSSILTKKEILKFYFSKEYFCYMTGFIAGMPFLGDLDENMRAQRLETPRVKVPKGSVALTEQFANIYTFESPGGWNIIGLSLIHI